MYKIGDKVKDSPWYLSTLSAAARRKVSRRKPATIIAVDGDLVTLRAANGQIIKCGIDTIVAAEVKS